MTTFLRDLRYALRMMSKHPGFTAIAVLTLAAGIGATTAMFSVINAVLLRPLPYPAAEQLVLLWESEPGASFMMVSYPDSLDWRQQNRTFEELAIYNRYGNLTLIGSETPRRLPAALVSWNLFRTLKVEPTLGRTFREEEDRAGAEPVAVISHGLWQQVFGGDRSVVGRIVSLDGEGHTILGVMPATFAFPSGISVWVPLGQHVNEGMMNRGNHPGLLGVGRMRSGITLEEARADLATVAARLGEEYPDTNRSVSAVVTPLREVMVRRIRPTLRVLFVAVGFVLLIACGNVANLLLARAAGRRREMAIRAALGAGRVRLFRQVLTESLVLALTGGITGLLLAAWGVEFLGTTFHTLVPRGAGIGIDLPVLAFSLLASMGTAFLFGVLPALRACRSAPGVGLINGGRGGAGAPRGRLRSAVVVAEVALSLVLLVGAGLMMKSFVQVLSISPGFEPRGLLTMQVSLAEARYPDDASIADFHGRLSERLAAAPGVSAVAVVNALPFGSGGWQAGITIEGMPDPAPNDNPMADAAAITPDYFRALGVDLLRGRGFDERDNSNALRVVVVSESFASRFWPDQDPLGKRLKFGSYDSEHPWTTVVGVVADVRNVSLEIAPPTQMYFPYRQQPGALRDAEVAVRADRDPAELAATVRAAIAEIDPNQPIYGVQPMQQRLSSSTAQRRFAIILMGVFAVLALLLALAGIYGVMAYLVARRSHEFGVRMALGARPGDLLRLVLGQGFRLSLLGLLVGIGAALALTRVLGSLLFQVSPSDPTTYAAVGTLMLLVGLLASWAPARRAMRVDPIRSLRCD